MIREVWAEFADGSVAKYGVEDDDLPGLLNRFLDSGVSCTLWVDGQLWKPCERLDAGDSNDNADQISQ